MKAPHYGRMNFVGLILTGLALLLIVQVWNLQNGKDSARLRKKAEDLVYYTYTRLPERGSIYDRYGRLLAGNRTIYEVGIDYPSLCNPQTVAETVTNVLGIEYQKVFEAANLKFTEKEKFDNKELVYFPLNQFVEPEQIAKLENIKRNYDKTAKGKCSTKIPDLSGLTWVARSMRSYPENNLAANVLGFYAFRNTDEINQKGNVEGYFGVEEYYDDELSGKPLEMRIPIDPSAVYDLPIVPPATSIILTIDREMQSSVEKIIDNAVRSTGAKSGTVLILDPKTGEILVMATSPRIDLNSYEDYKKMFPAAPLYNRAVGQPFEPGSVFKVLTMAAALDSNTVKADTVFEDTGSIDIGGAIIKNWDGGAHGKVNMTECMQQSLNVCLAWLAKQMGPTKFYEYLKDFGIHRKTNVDLSPEMIFPVFFPGDSNWTEAELGTNSFGQGVSLNALQMIMAVSAVANDGKIMSPHILRAMIHNGQQYPVVPQIVSQPISAQAARELTAMLTVSMEGESQNKAVVEGYKVAGKTGTAQISDGKRYLDDVTNASFIGWGPTDDPHFVVFVWLEEPKTSIWGSIVASPIFKDVVKSIVVYLDLPPDEIRQKLAKK